MTPRPGRVDGHGEQRGENKFEDSAEQGQRTVATSLHWDDGFPSSFLCPITSELMRLVRLDIATLQGLFRLIVSSISVLTFYALCQGPRFHGRRTLLRAGKASSARVLQCFRQLRTQERLPSMQAAIREWLKSSNMSPSTGLPLTSLNLVPVRLQCFKKSISEAL